MNGFHELIVFEPMISEAKMNYRRYNNRNTYDHQNIPRGNRDRHMLGVKGNYEYDYDNNDRSQSRPAWPRSWDRARASFSDATERDMQNFRSYESRVSPDYQSDLGNPRDTGPMTNFKENVRNFFGKGPKGYKRSDERIHEDVCEALYHHPQIDASEVEVSVRGGTVTLTGAVEDRQTKRLIEDVVEQCAGVTNVSNQILVSQTSGLQSQNPPVIETEQDQKRTSRLNSMQ